MHLIKSLLVLTAVATLAPAFSFETATELFSKVKRELEPAPRSGGGGNGAACPAIWTQIVPVLVAAFRDPATGQCTALARQAVRAGFHDCGSWNLTDGTGPGAGGCDGSLILAGELAFPENNGMQQLGAFLSSVVQQFGNKVTTADMIQFAAATAVVTCPNGPQIQVFVGRPDSHVAEPNGLLPNPAQSAPFLTNLFAAKGFTAEELAALLGAHTASQQFFVDPALAGESQDDTPGIWDVHFYANTFNPPPGVFVFQSDKVLSTFGDVGKAFQGFVNNQGKWNGKFASAMTHISLNGIAGGSANLIDCTSALPAPTKTKAKRVKSAPINARVE